MRQIDIRIRFARTSGVDDRLLIILAGWPFILLTAVLIVGGLLRHKSLWIWSASVLALPASLYLAATPFFGYLGLTLPILLVASGFALRRNARMLAWAMALPYLSIITWLAVKVLNQSAG